MIRILALIAIGLLIFSLPSDARRKGGIAIPGGSFSYPGDVSGANWTTAWPLFAFTSAKAHAGATSVPVVNVIGETTSTSCTIYLKGDGTPDVDLTTSGGGGVGHQCVGGARTFCSVTNSRCDVTNVTDATGGGQDCSQIIGVLYLALDQPSTGKIAIDSGVFSSETNWCLATNAITPATGLVSLAAFGRQENSTCPTFCGKALIMVEIDAGQALEMGSNAGQWTTTTGADHAVEATAAVNQWHSGVGIVNGVTNGGVLSIDGNEFTGGPAVSYPFISSEHPFAFTNNNYNVGTGTHTYGSFAAFADNVQWSQTQRQQICHALYTIEGQITPGTFC